MSRHVKKSKVTSDFGANKKVASRYMKLENEMKKTQYTSEIV